MKRIFCAILALALAISLAACGEKKAPQVSIPGTPQEIIEMVYTQHRQLLLSLVSADIDLTDENALSYYTGLTSAEKLSAASISEPMQGQPYSLVIVRVKNAADAAQIAKDMYESVNTRKWICMEADTKTAAYCGDVVMFFMVNSEFADSATTESMLEAFQKLCGGSATVIG